MQLISSHEQSIDPFISSEFSSCTAVVDGFDKLNVSQIFSEKRESAKRLENALRRLHNNLNEETLPIELTSIQALSTFERRAQNTISIPPIENHKLTLITLDTKSQSLIDLWASTQTSKEDLN
jgi:hypothetical protein